MHANQQVSSFKFQHVDHLNCSHSVLKTCVCLFYNQTSCFIYRRCACFDAILFMEKEINPK